MQEFVYFVSYQNGPIKIGKAKNITARMSGLQTGSPHKLELMGVMRGSRGLEHKLHDKFSSLRLSGEWFERRDPLISFIETHSSDPASLYYKKKYLTMEDELNKIRRELKNKRSEIEKSFQKQIETEVYDSLKEGIVDLIDGAVENYRGLMKLHNRIINGTAFIAEGDDAEKAIRIELQSIFKIDWRQSRIILNSDKYDRRSVRDSIENLVTRKISNSVDRYYKKKGTYDED